MEEFFSGIDPDDFDSKKESDDVISFNFGSDFDIKKESKLGKDSNMLFDGDGSDDEERKFFEALASEFSQRGQNIGQGDVVDSADPFGFNDMDDQQLDVHR